MKWERGAFKWSRPKRLRTMECNKPPLENNKPRCTCRRLHKRIETNCIDTGSRGNSTSWLWLGRSRPQLHPSLPQDCATGSNRCAEGWTAAHRLHDGVGSSREAELPLTKGRSSRYDPCPGCALQAKIWFGTYSQPQRGGWQRIGGWQRVGLCLSLEGMDCKEGSRRVHESNCTGLPKPSFNLLSVRFSMLQEELHAKNRTTDCAESLGQWRSEKSKTFTRENPCRV